MNSFFKTFWAALLAFVIGTGLFFMLVLLLISGIAAAFTPKQTPVVSNSVIRLDLASNIVDSPDNKISSINFNNFSITGSNTILEMLNAIDHAATDQNIRGIYINLVGAGGMETAHVEELRAALQRFRDSGKFVVSYEETYSQLGYYLGSVADKVFLNPEGGMDWNGLSASVMFYKGLLDKLDIDVEILRHGTYKSAVEPFMTDRMSPANREQMTLLVNSMWGMLLDDISSSRGIPATDLQQYATDLAVATPADARRLGLVDDLLYEDQVMSVLNGYIVDGYSDIYDPQAGGSAPAMISLGEYAYNTSLYGRRLSKNKVAVIYADGDIMDGDSYPGVVGSATVARQLAQARQDNGVKAVVLRVNSPGGSALASEVMWREAELLRQEKPLVVSMGSYAASGGYYISCNADVILADRSTMTGSIGVFGLMMNIGRTMKENLGITVDVVRTNPHADMGQAFRGLTRKERDYLQIQVENTYKTFVGHVAQGRNMSYEAVDMIGEGRVWLGTDANNVGLVDGFGGIQDAIALAAERAGIHSDYRVWEITGYAGTFESMLRSLSGVMSPKVESKMGEAFVHYNKLMNTISTQGVQTRMPYSIEIQ